MVPELSSKRLFDKQCTCILTHAQYISLASSSQTSHETLGEPPDTIPSMFIYMHSYTYWPPILIIQSCQGCIERYPQPLGWSILAAVQKERIRCHTMKHTTSTSWRSWGKYSPQQKLRWVHHTYIDYHYSQPINMKALMQRVNGREVEIGELHDDQVSNIPSRCLYALTFIKSNHYSGRSSVVNTHSQSKSDYTCTI